MGATAGTTTAARMMRANVATLRFVCPLMMTRKPTGDTYIWSVTAQTTVHPLCTLPCLARLTSLAKLYLFGYQLLPESERARCATFFLLWLLSSRQLLSHFETWYTLKPRVG